MEEDRHPHLLRLADDRPRDIAAGADGHIGVKIFDNLFRPMAGEGEPVGRLDIVGDIPGEEAAVKTGDLDVGDGVPCFGIIVSSIFPGTAAKRNSDPG